MVRPDSHLRLSIALVALFMAFFAYYKSDSIALAATRAKPADGPEYRRFHNLVEGLCIAAGLPKPRLYVIDDGDPRYWDWEGNGTEIRLTLVFRQGEKTFAHGFTFKRVKV